MEVKTHICLKQTINPHIGTECWDSEGVCFLFDRNKWVHIGDEVKCERDEKGFYRRIWVNGELKTANKINETH